MSESALARVVRSRSAPTLPGVMRPTRAFFAVESRSLRARRFLPAVAMRNYRWEALSAWFIPLAIACVEGEVVGVVARKALGASDVVVAAITAAPTAALLSSLWWGRLIRGRDRVRITVGLQLALIACVMGAALTPATPAGSLLLLLLVFVARVSMTGIIASRADVWRTNYSRALRARAAGRLTAIASLVVTLTGLALAVALDLVPDDDVGVAFRGGYIAAGALAVAGVWAYSRVRWRRGKTFVRAEREHDAAAGRSNGFNPLAGAMDSLRVLRDDRDYREYMIAQFTLGIANIGLLAPFILTLDRLDLSYAATIGLTQATPIVVALLVIPMWSRLLDRSHIVRFRALQAWVFVASSALTCVGALSGSVAMLFLARAIWGVARGGGMIAWQIGHHDFAPARLASLYMGAHVTLTGVRGLIAPFAATALYSGAAIALGGAHLRVPAIGGWVFAIMAGTSALGGILFVRLDARLRRKAAEAIKGDSEPSASA